jgi:hypothetical protein
MLSGLTTDWFIATIMGRTPLHYGVPAASFGGGWLAFNLVLVAAAITRIRALRYGAERRASVRFPVALPAHLDRVSCIATDLSLTGACLSAPRRFPGEPSTLVLKAPSRAWSCAAPCGLVSTNQTVAVEFQPGQWPAISALTYLLFNAGVGLDVVPELIPIGAVA